MYIVLTTSHNNQDNSSVPTQMKSSCARDVQFCSIEVIFYECGQNAYLDYEMLQWYLSGVLLINRKHGNH